MGIEDEVQEEELQESSDIRSLIEKICQLTEENTILANQNQELVSLAQNERLLKEENIELRNENKELKSNQQFYERNLKQKDQQIEKLQNSIDDMSAKYNQIINKMPKEETIEKWKSAFEDAHKSILLVNWSSISNIGVVLIVGIFLLVSVFYTVSADKNAEKAYNNTDSIIQKVDGGLYNTDGYSVIEGSKSSKAVYDATHIQK